MKKLFTVIICLMAMVLSANAQNEYPTTVLESYAKWVISNDGKSIEEFINSKWYNKHYYDDRWGSTSDDAYVKRVRKENLDRLDEHRKRFLANPNLDDFLEYCHSDEYGHFQCGVKKGSSWSYVHAITDTYKEYEKKKDYYKEYARDCLICHQEQKALGYKFYEKLLKKRYRNWINSEEYKAKEKEKKLLLEKLKKEEKERDKKRKEYFNSLCK